MKLNRREFARRAALLGGGAWLGGTALAAPRQKLAYDDWIVIDACGAPGDQSADKGTPMSAQAIADVRSSGVSAISVTVGGVGAMDECEAFTAIAGSIAFWQHEIDHHPEALMGVRSYADLGTARALNRTGLVFALQDGLSFQHDLDLLETLHGLGLRVIQPTYNLRNELGDGCLEPGNAGLSRSGHEAVERMNALGILVDLSHCGQQTTDDAVAHSAKPVAYTHTGCGAVYAHPRNKTDAQLRALADKGGVAGIFVMPYLRGDGQPTAADVVRHIEHAIDVMGEDHVGVGTDGQLSPVDLTPEYIAQFAEVSAKRREAGIAAPREDADSYLFAKDLNTPQRFETLAGLLLARRHRSARIEKILGGNFARLFAEAWAAG